MLRMLIQEVKSLIEVGGTMKYDKFRACIEYSSYLLFCSALDVMDMDPEGKTFGRGRCFAAIL